MHALTIGPSTTNDAGAGTAAVHEIPDGPVAIADAARSRIDCRPEHARTETRAQTQQIPRIYQRPDNNWCKGEPQQISSLGRVGNTGLEGDRLHFGIKRPAPEELSSNMDVKRFKTDDEDKSEQETQPPAPSLNIPFPDKPAVLEERAGEIEYRVVNNDGARESIIILTGLKCLFQKQLPNMPKDYIARLVYDRNHLSLALVKRPIEVVGGICYRPFGARRFAEIVFCAVSSDQQVKCYGAHIMSHLKDYVRATTTPPIVHLLTYADNYATGYFQKQGFTKDVTLERALWAGCIKDYEGGTLMQCTMLPRVRYLEAGRMLLKQKEAVLAKTRPLSRSHVVHPPPAQWAATAAAAAGGGSGGGGVITPIDPLSIPAIRATGWCPEMDEMAREPRHGPHFNELRRFLYQIQNHKQAWPFLAPVSRDEVPDYYTVITEPMDLATMEERLARDAYAGPGELIRDMKLILSNCRTYNDVNSIYHKCAAKVEKYMWSLVREVPEWHSVLDEEASSGGRGGQE